MPIVQIDLLEGRSVEQKRVIAERITKILVEDAKCQPEGVSIIFRDMKQCDFAQAGLLKCDKNKK